MECCSYLCNGCIKCCSGICNYFSWPYALAITVILIILIIYYATKAIDIVVVICIVIAIVALLGTYWYCGSNTKKKGTTGENIRLGSSEDTGLLREGNNVI